MEGKNPFIGFINVTTEYYSRDISKKCRLSNFVKENVVEPLALPPYGYMKDPNNPKKWIIDEEPAKIVRRIFNEFLNSTNYNYILELYRCNRNT